MKRGGSVYDRKQEPSISAEGEERGLNQGRGQQGGGRDRCLILFPSLQWTSLSLFQSISTVLVLVSLFPAFILFPLWPSRSSRNAAFFTFPPACYNLVLCSRLYHFSMDTFLYYLSTRFFPSVLFVTSFHSRCLNRFPLVVLIFESCALFHASLFS